MGWKSCYIIATAKDCPPGYLGTMPTHDATRASEIIKKFGYGESNRRPSPIIDYPSENVVTIGAYEKAVIITDQVVYDCFDDRDHPFFKQALSIFPDGTLCMIILHSVVNLYGYALYENGQLVREFAGCADDGITHEFGEPLPEERDAFSKSKNVDGERVFLVEYDGTIEEVSHDGYGENLVFEVASRFYGEKVDQPVSDHLWPEALQGEAIDKKPASKGPEPKKSEVPWWQRIFK